eukprot:jgi/Orpsp1_1/1179059/evm.model.c7180000067774.1
MDCKEFTWILFCIIWIACCFIPSSEAYDDNLFSDSLVVIKRTNDTIQARIAAFGPRLGEEGIQGVVIPMELIDKDREARYGCKIIKEKKIKKFSKRKYGIENLDDGFVALVERGGGCSFSDKVRYMQESGAKAVIVGNNYGDYHLITMYASGDTTDIRIPSVFILQYDMFTIREDYSFEEISIIESDSDWPVTDLFMMTTLLPIVFIFGIFIIYKFRIDTFETELHHTESSASLGAATQEEVDALPIKIFSMKKMKENDPETCAVCIDDFKDGDKLRVLPCRHEYHVECIDLWLTTRKKFCPICKRNISGDDDADENTPLLARTSSNNNSNYNTDESILSIDTESEISQDESHIIDIPLEADEQEDQGINENEDNIENAPTSQDIIHFDDESDDPGENDPLINYVNRA